MTLLLIAVFSSALTAQASVAEVAGVIECPGGLYTGTVSAAQMHQGERTSREKVHLLEVTTPQKV
eukprot:8508110-Prorocentrum_lima.AAC.1